MGKAKIAVSMERKLATAVDRLVRQRIFNSRSQAVSIAVEEKLIRLNKSRLARECAKLDPKTEKTLAEEGIGEELGRWPEY